MKHLCVMPRNVLQRMRVNVLLVMVIALNVSVVYGIMVGCHVVYCQRLLAMQESIQDNETWVSLHVGAVTLLNK